MTDPVDHAFVRGPQAGPRLPQTLLETAVQESLNIPARVWRSAWRAMLTTVFSADLGQIDAPTLVVLGDQDQFAPASEHQALGAAIAHARLIVYPGGGHNLRWEEPERFAADLAAFVAGLERA